MLSIHSWLDRAFHTSLSSLMSLILTCWLYMIQLLCGFAIELIHWAWDIAACRSGGRGLVVGSVRESPGDGIGGAMLRRISPEP